jgi:uncharacterized membrane protein
MRELGVVKRLVGEGHFRWRGEEITRLEGFSDAVFALAVTLLVVSLATPKSFRELMEVMQGFAGFGLGFALLAYLWFKHYQFFRRYGIQDTWSVFLNCVLLFFVLFYVYPLKYLSTAIFNGSAMSEGEARVMFIIYGSGFASVFLVFVLLYLHAWGKREALALNDIELLRTGRSIVDMLAMVIVGLISIVMALSLPSQWIGSAGYFYSIVAVYFAVAVTIFGRRERRLLEKLRAAEAIVARSR